MYTPRPFGTAKARMCSGRMSSPCTLEPRQTTKSTGCGLDRTVSAAHCPAVLAPLAQGGELAPSKKLMAAAKLSRGSSLLRWRRRGNLRQEPEVDDGIVWHIRVAPGAWRAVITELVAQGKDVACDFFFERK